MKVGIETGVALIAAGLLGSTQVVSAAEQDSQAQPSSVATAATRASTTRTQTSHNASTHQVENASTETTEDDAQDVHAQLQKVVSTGLQASASAQVAKQQQAEYDTQKATHDNHAAQVRSDEETYVAGTKAYLKSKESFESDQSQVQTQIHNYDQQNKKYQTQVQAYNDQQTARQDNASIVAGIAQYEAGQSMYNRGIEQVSTGVAQYQSGLSTYRKAVDNYDPYTATMADYANIQSGHSQLSYAQSAIKAGSKQVLAAQHLLQTAYQQLTTAFQKADKTSNAENQAIYAALSTQYQSLLAEATRLKDQQADFDQNGERAQDLMTTYQDLLIQDEALERQQNQLSAETEALEVNGQALALAKQRAEDDEVAAEAARSNAQLTLSTQWHDWFDDANANGDYNQTSTPDGLTSSHVATDTQANAALEYSAYGPIQVTTSAIALPIELLAPVNLELKSITAPIAFTLSRDVTDEIWLPEKPSAGKSTPSTSVKQDATAKQANTTNHSASGSTVSTSQKRVVNSVNQNNAPGQEVTTHSVESQTAESQQTHSPLSTNKGAQTTQQPSVSTAAGSDQHNSSSSKLTSSDQTSATGSKQSPTANSNNATKQFDSDSPSSNSENNPQRQLHSERANGNLVSQEDKVENRQAVRAESDESVLKSQTQSLNVKVSRTAVVKPTSDKHEVKTVSESAFPNTGDSRAQTLSVLGLTLLGVIGTVWVKIKLRLHP